MKMLFLLMGLFLLGSSEGVLAKSLTLKPKFLFQFGKQGSNKGEFVGPKDVAIDLSDRIYVLDEKRIQVFVSNGIYLAEFSSTNFVRPYALAIGRLGNIYVTDIEANCVHVFNKDFQYMQKFGSTGNGEGELYCPRQIAIGESENVYVVDWHNERVVKFNSVGGFLTNFVFPGSDIWGLAVNPEGVGR
ncbi:MAG: NHL repeat-containing protein [Verrucomicrobiia bacterium]